MVSQSELSSYCNELLEELNDFVNGAGKIWIDDAWAAGMYLLNMCGSYVMTFPWPACELKACTR